MLLVALLASLATLSVRVFELPSNGLRAGLALHRTHGAPKASGDKAQAMAAHVGDVTQGKRIFLGTCAACHGPDGSGVKGQGQNLRDSTFLSDKTDAKALAFVKTGRQPFDPEGKLHLAMPARGGNPSLTDASLLDAIATVSTAAKATSSDQPQVIDGELWLPHSIVPAAQVGPVGSVAEMIALQKPGAEGHSGPNVRRFFLVQLFVNGLHAIYLVFGVVFVGWALWQKPGRVGGSSSLSISALYWIVISAIGLLLVPAYYA